MTIKHGDTPGVSISNLERALESREVSHANTSPSESKVPTPVNDQIALSMASKLLQQTTAAGEEVRLERILQLKTAIQNSQYGVDPMKVSHALIESELLGY